MRLPLRLKLSVLIISLLTVTVIFVSGFLLRTQQRTLADEMRKRGLTIAQNLAAGAKTALLTRDDLGLQLLVRDVARDGDVVYVAVTDSTGKVIAHSDLAQMGRALGRPHGATPLGDAVLVQTFPLADHGDVVDVSVPLVFRQVRVGAAYVGFSQAAIAEAVGRARIRAFVITLAMLALGVGGAVWLAAALARPIVRLMQGTRAVADGDFSVTLPVTSRDELGTLTTAFNDMARSLGEKEMIKRAFSRYVTREVVDEILKDPEQLALTGARREVTVLFCDVRGFTATAERLQPEEVVELLNEFYELMIETTFKYDGTLDKFLGDGVMAVFGAPLYRPDHTLMAARAALAMQAGIRRAQPAPRAHRQATGRRGHRPQRGRGHRRHGGDGRAHGVHRRRRQREPGGAARGGRRTRPDPGLGRHVRAAQRCGPREKAGTLQREGAGQVDRGVRAARAGRMVSRRRALALVLLALAAGGCASLSIGTPTPALTGVPTADHLAAPHRAQAEALERGGHLRQAAEEWTTALALAPDHEPSRQARKRLRERMERELAEHMKEGWHALARDDAADAHRHFLAALALDPDSQAAQQALRATPAPANGAVARPVSLTPSSPRLETMAKPRVESNGTARPLTASPPRPLGEDARKPDALYASAQAHLAEQRDAEAYRALAQLVNVSPGYKDSATLLRNVRARLVQQRYQEGLRLLREERLEAAIEQWRGTLELDPKHANARRNIEQAERILRTLAAQPKP